MRSNEIKKGAVRAPNRCLMYATGVSNKDLGKPFIGIASSFTDLVPGHIGERKTRGDERCTRVFQRTRWRADKQTGDGGT